MALDGEPGLRAGAIRRSQRTVGRAVYGREDLERIRAYLRFGAGAAVGHSGGRYTWQLAGSDNLLVTWKIAEGAREQESALLSAFVAKFGQLPFANLTY